MLPHLIIICLISYKQDDVIKLPVHFIKAGDHLSEEAGNRSAEQRERRIDKNGSQYLKQSNRCQKSWMDFSYQRHYTKDNLAVITTADII